MNRVITTDRDPQPQLHADRWQQHGITQQIQMCRTGWLGAWDAFVAALLRRPQFTVATPVTLSIWAKCPEGTVPVLSITQTQLETHQ
jgi:hypothetical protein